MVKISMDEKINGQLREIGWYNDTKYLKVL